MSRFLSGSRAQRAPPYNCSFLWSHRSLPRGLCAPVRSQAPATTGATESLEGLMRQIEEDAPNLFNDKGMDTSIYAEDVMFRDPITKYDDVQGFVKNLNFLKNTFNPTYDVLGTRKLNDTDVEARWSMGFDVTPIKNSPLSAVWQPRMEFTGTTVYGTNPETGLVEKHLDAWDNLDVQDYFSVQGFADVLGQIFSFEQTPNLDGPKFSLLKRKKEYCIRKYEPFVVAQTQGGSSGLQRGQQFQTLAKYLFGGNSESRSMPMTTPVITSEDRMQFVLTVPSPGEAPVDSGSAVAVAQEDMSGGLVACIRFAGIATEGLAASKTQELKRLMQQDGLKAELLPSGEAKSLLLQYNDPGTLPPFRRNEVLIPIAGEFDVWES